MNQSCQLCTVPESNISLSALGSADSNISLSALGLDKHNTVALSSANLNTKCSSNLSSQYIYLNILRNILCVINILPSIYIVILKRDSPTRFSTSSFFHHSNLSGALTNGLKYFRFWFRFRGVIRSLGSKKLTPRGIIPRGVKNKFNPRTMVQKRKM